MKDEDVKRCTDELREKNPKMFSQPDQKPNEICISIEEEEVVFLNVRIYRQRGFTTARQGSLPIPTATKYGSIGSYPVFMDAREYFGVVDRRKKQEGVDAQSQETA